MSQLPRRAAAIVFLAFAFSYFLSALLRAVTATLAPTLTQEFNLTARNLGLLAGGYFLGFASMQLPLGTWLDRHGPKRVLLGFLSVAVVGCIAFSLANSFALLLAARVLIGVGVGACLMAPLTGARRWLPAAAQLRANSWLLMTGSLGMLASTLPVQWLVPHVGWRPLFWALALLLLVAMATIAWRTPGWPSASTGDGGGSPGSYAAVWRNAYFRRLAPLGFFTYAGLLAVQTLWAGPWMIRVSGYTPVEAAAGLFVINLCMLVTFWTWGLLGPRLARSVDGADRLMAWGIPTSLAALAALIAAGPAAGAGALAVFCMTCTFVSLAQPAVGMAFPPELAGRALSAYNLVIFSGVFVVQWGIGLLVDAFAALGLSQVAAFRGAFGVFLACSAASYAWFLLGTADNRPDPQHVR